MLRSDSHTLMPATANSRPSTAPSDIGYVPRMLVFPVCGNSNQIVCHLVIAGMHRFIVHREHEDAVEVTLHDLLEIRHRLAVDMPGLALRRSIGLRLE